MTVALQEQGYVSGGVLYMALELGNRSWKVCFGDGRRRRQVSVPARSMVELGEQIERARARFGLAADSRVMSCYEAGRDGFWLHRCLVSRGVENVVVDSSSIEVNRRRRRAKTDRLDGEALLGQLVRYMGGERRVWSVVRVPSRAAEDGQRLFRERERLVKERTAHRNRLSSLLVTQGLVVKVGGDFGERLDGLRLWDGSALSPDLRAELERQWRRYQQVQAQIGELEAEQRARVAAAASGPEQQIRQLLMLKSLGWQISWALVMELFGWRAFRNRRQLGGCTGLTPTPYGSGDSERETGISKAGSRRVRRLLIELAWLWLQHQPDSELSQWFRRRFGGQGQRARRVGIVALARKLVIALWRYLETGVIPAGAVLKAAP